MTDYGPLFLHNASQHDICMISYKYHSSCGDDVHTRRCPDSTITIKMGRSYALYNLGFRHRSALFGIRYMAGDADRFQDWISVATHTIGQVWLLDNFDSGVAA